MDYKKKYEKYKKKYVSLAISLGVNRKPLQIGIYLGRFQPLHNGHFKNILTALKNEDYVIVFISQSGVEEYKNVQNPYSYNTRKLFIEDSVKEVSNSYLKKLSILPFNPNREGLLTTESNPSLESKIIDELNEVFDYKITLTNVHTKFNLSVYGAKKDEATSEYLDEIVTKSIVKNSKFVDSIMSATDIRILIDEKNIISEENKKTLKTMIPNAVLKIIIRKKEDYLKFDPVDKDGLTKIMKVAKSGNYDFLAILLNNRNYNINMKSNEGFTALHYAIINGHLNIIKFLYEIYSADLKVYDNDGNDILMLAIINQKIDIIKYILQFYYVNKINKKGETTIELAKKTGNKEIIDLIEANVNSLFIKE